MVIPRMKNRVATTTRDRYETKERCMTGILDNEREPVSTAERRYVVSTTSLHHYYLMLKVVEHPYYGL